MARLSDLIDLMGPPSAGDDSLAVFARELSRECARCAVIVSVEQVFERLEVPLLAHVSMKPGRSYVRLTVAQGPVGGIGGRPLPAAVMASSDIRTWNNRGPYQWVGARRTSFGGVEVEVWMPDEEGLWTVLKRLRWALAQDGDLRNFALPNPRDGVVLMREAGAALPWRGYDLRAA